MEHVQSIIGKDVTSVIQIYRDGLEWGGNIAACHDELKKMFLLRQQVYQHQGWWISIPMAPFVKGVLKTQALLRRKTGTLPHCTGKLKIFNGRVIHDSIIGHIDITDVICGPHIGILAWMSRQR